MAQLRRIIVFPFVFGGIMIAATHLLTNGADPATTTMWLTATGAGLILILERIQPYRRVWLNGRGDLKTDVLHNAINFGVREGFNALCVGTLVGASVWLTDQVSAQLWPSTWPLSVQLLVALTIGEFGTYWIHRLMHERELLWRLHATHHSSPRLYWFNAGRFHPIDLLAQHALGTAPLILLGAGGPVIALFALFTALHGLFQHANIDVKLGPLNWFFSMSELHRWHHSKDPEEANHNYGANIILWDLVFGTHYLPKDREPPEDTGIGNLPNFPQTYWAQFLSPFQWK